VDEDVSWEEIAPKNDKAEEKWQLDGKREICFKTNHRYNRMDEC
jgi:hypothetical protein